MDVKWIKITTDIFDDEKILLIESLPDSDSIIVIWFKLLCMAGKQNNGGVFMFNDRMAYTDEMLATVFRRNINTVRMALETFEQFGMIERIEGVVTIPNWEKHQNIDGLEKIRAQTRERVARHRSKQKALLESKEECNVTCNDTVTISNDADIDKNKNKSKNKVFKPPTLEEVLDYCRERKNNVDAQRFIDYYSSNGWMVGKNKMKDWKAAVRTWERNNYSSPAPAKTNGPKSFEQHQYNDLDMLRIAGY